MMRVLQRPKQRPESVLSPCPETVPSSVRRASGVCPVNTPIPHVLGTLSMLAQSPFRFDRNRNRERALLRQTMARSKEANIHG